MNQKTDYLPKVGDGDNDEQVESSREQTDEGQEDVNENSA